MTLSVHRVTPELIGELDGALATLVAHFTPAIKCALDGPDAPGLEWLQACVVEAEPHHHVALAVDDAASDVAGLVVVHLSLQRIVWLVPNGGRADVTAVASALCAFVADDIGVAQGMVENPAVRTLWVTHDARFDDSAGADPDIVWVPGP